MISAMIDLETLDTERTAAIVSIGMAFFDEERIVKTLYCRVNLKECFDRGMTLSKETAKWWFEQSYAVQAELTNPHRLGLESALKVVRDQLATVDGQVWSCGSFDLEILTHAFGLFSMEPAWKYWQARDFRTVRELEKWQLPEREGDAHNALCDVWHQTNCLLAIKKQMRGGRGEN